MVIDKIVEHHLFFNGWDPIYRVLIVGLVSYFALIMLLRAAGKRTLSRMNAYDLVITMALGSIMANVLLTPDISIAESVAASAVLIFLQFFLTFIAFHIPVVRTIISSKPALLFHNGKYIEKNLKRERVCKSELQCAMNEEGIDKLSDVRCIILESNGEICVIAKDPSQAHRTRQTKKD